MPGDEGLSYPLHTLHTFGHSLVTHVGVRPGAHVVLERRHVPVDDAHYDVARNDRGAVK